MMENLPAVSHRFMVNFLFNYIPSPLDIGFQRVSGLGRELSVTQHREGGENAKNLWLADRVEHGSLVLERGVMRRESTAWANVVIMLLDHNMLLPVTVWTISNAMPVSWRIGDMDASSNTVLINTLELRYQDMRVLGTKL